MDNQNKKEVNFGMYGIVFGFFSGVAISFLIEGISLEYGAVIGMGIGYFIGKNIKKK